MSFLVVTLFFSIVLSVIYRPLPTPSRIPLASDNTIYIGTGQVVSNGPVLSSNIYISNMVWQDKCNELGGILVNGTRYNVSVVFVDLGSTIRTLSDAEIVANITRVWKEFVGDYTTNQYGRIDFTVTPFSTTYALPALLVANPAKMFTVSGMLIQFVFTFCLL